MNLKTVKIPAQPTAANSSQEINTLHVIGPDGKIRHIQGSTLSGGFFSSIYASRPGIITLLSPCVRPRGASESLYHTPSINDPGIFVLPIGLQEGDWVIAREEQIYTCDPGWADHLIAGNLPAGIESVSQLMTEIRKAAALVENSGGTLPFVEFKLYPA